jgi:hypothetical protein
MGSARVASLARSLIHVIGFHQTMLYLGIGKMIVVDAIAQFLKFPLDG